MTSFNSEARALGLLLRFFFAVGGLALVLRGFAAAAAISKIGAGLRFCHTEAGGVGGVDGLGYLADVFTAIAFGADGVNVRCWFGILGGKAEFGFPGDGGFATSGGRRRGDPDSWRTSAGRVF